MTRERIHLRAQAPNEGARRLAWWLGHQRGDDAISRFADAIREPVSHVDRLLSGEIVPGGEMAHKIHQATGGAVWRFDWRTAAVGGWFDVPSERAPTRRAA